MKTHARFVAFSMAAALSMSATALTAFADDAGARSLLDQATATYNARGEGKLTEESIKASLDAAFDAAQDATLKYEILVLASKSYYYVGNHTDGADNKMRLFEAGMAKMKTAQDIGKATDSLKDPADAYYFYAVNLGQWAQAKGIIASLGRKNELITAFKDTLARKARDGKAGEVIDGYGTFRGLGRLYHKLPSFAGGSHTRALEYLRKAAGTPEGASFVLTTYYLADTLAVGDDGEREEAKKVLVDLTAKPLSDSMFDQSRTPENNEEMDRAKSLLKDLS